MERITTNGVVYVKASSIARELGYTADYVGQLCRSEQVDAQLVGRNWFVNEDSIREHKRNRYRSTKTKSKQMLSETIAEAMARTQPVTASEPESNVRYETDESEVIPSIGEKMPGESTDTEEGTESTDEEENIVPIRFEPNTSTVDDEVASEEHVENADTVEESEKVKEEEEVVHSVAIRKEAPQKPVHTAVHTDRPVEMRAKTASPVVSPLHSPQKPAEVSIKEPVPSSFRAEQVVIMASLATAVALIGAVTLIGLESHILVDQGGSLDTYNFNLAAAAAALQELR